MAQQAHHRLLLLARTVLSVPDHVSFFLSRLPMCFGQRVLQLVEFGPPPCQRCSVFGVIEVGALSMEAARSLAWKISCRQINSIR